MKRTVMLSVRGDFLVVTKWEDRWHTATDEHSRANVLVLLLFACCGRIVSLQSVAFCGSLASALNLRFDIIFDGMNEANSCELLRATERR